MRWPPPLAALRNSNPARSFLILFGVAICLRVYFDIETGRLGVHRGELFRYRNPFGLPLYSVAIFYLELFITVAGGLALIFDRVRLGGCLVLLGISMSLTQTFQHQKMLFWFVALGLTLAPRFDDLTYRFLKNQLAIVYFTSVIHKIATGFISGTSLRNAFTYGASIETWAPIKTLLPVLAADPTVQILSGATLAFELMIPFLLLKWPKLGVATAIGLHLSMSLLLKDVLPFSMGMIALALLSLTKPVTEGRDVAILD